MDQESTMSRAEQYAANAYVVGMRMQHPYVGVYRSEERIEITFLKISIPSITVSLDGLEERLSGMVFDSLLGRQRADPTPEGQAEYAKFLECSNGIYGVYKMMTPGMMVFGYIQLLPALEAKS
jgi:hypothetical protein